MICFKRNDMDAKRKFIWKYADDNEMIFWPKSAKCSFLTSSSRLISESYIQRGGARRGKIEAVGRDVPPILERLGIVWAGFSTMPKSFYQIIGKRKYFMFFVVEDGEMPLSVGNKKTVLVRHDFLLIPPSVDFAKISVDRGCAFTLWGFLDADWFRHKRGLAEIEIFRKFKCSELVLHIARAYELEAYSENCNTEILWNLARALVSVLRKNLDTQPPARDFRKIGKFIDALKRGESFAVSLPEAAKTLGISPSALNDYCQARYSASFSKCVRSMKMESALEHLRHGESVCETAARLGYANQFVFSRAFKKHFGSSPKNFAGR